MDSYAFYILDRYVLPLAQDSLPLCIAIATIAVVLLVSVFSKSERDKVPTVGFYGRLVPDFFSRLRFNSSAPTVIYAGYKKYKDLPYRILKPDGDLIVIPSKYCEELRALPDTKLNALEATFKNHVGNYTSILKDSHLHTDTILRRLTPGLPRVVPRIVDELRYAFEVDFPNCENEWVAIRPYDVILRLIARAGSRVFIGIPVCRDEAWIDSSISFTSNIFETMALLRPFPGFMQPFVAKFLPSTRRLDKQLKSIKEDLLVPIINKRRAVEQSGDPDYEKPDDFLQWMMDLAENATDAEAGNLAHRLLGILSMAVVHTSAMASVHVLFDLITMPEYLEPLRAEIREKLPHGPDEATQRGLQNMILLDSFLRESQRFNPPAHLSFHRIVKEPMELSGGLKLAKWTHICMPSGPISMDNSIVPFAETFDGFRWFREGNATSAFVNTSPTNLHFGIGKFACPGRFFGSYMIKTILSRLLQEYDFKFEDTRRRRPKNILIGDKIVPDVFAKVLFKKRLSR
ncbi:cytochrome P450 [Lepidopterella palustris CBS 459.81]|uniref:Cytochrome P450 n=1 Tax=Lepidopterella palustris CBS 459.81 TaxID=1314670 RepID=A0A8E2ECT8_9PEZI|nr:cytochrome P450 [Lepidopterella palustris CBS 459.81]